MLKNRPHNLSNLWLFWHHSQDLLMVSTAELRAHIQRTHACALQLTEQAWESTSGRTGTVTIALPGLPDGVTVTRGTDTFFVDEGNTLLERNEVRVRPLT